MIDRGYFWGVVFVMTLGTLLIRGTLIAFSSRLKISDRVKQLFSFIPAAILPAFVTPAVYFHQGHVAWAGGHERLVVLGFAGIVCYFTRSTLATIVLGLSALYLVAVVLA